MDDFNWDMHIWVSKNEVFPVITMVVSILIAGAGGWLHMYNISMRWRYASNWGYGQLMGLRYCQRDIPDLGKRWPQDTDGQLIRSKSWRSGLIRGHLPTIFFARHWTIFQCNRDQVFFPADLISKECLHWRYSVYTWVSRVPTQQFSSHYIPLYIYIWFLWFHQRFLNWFRNTMAKSGWNFPLFHGMDMRPSWWTFRWRLKVFIAKCCICTRTRKTKTPALCLGMFGDL